MATEVLDREELINTIWRKSGKIGLVAREMGVDAKTIYNYAKRWGTVRSAIDNARLQFDETLVDTAEVGLQRAVIDIEAWAIKYTLSTKGKSRGYVERQEIAGVKDAPLHIVGLEETARKIWGKSDSGD